MQNSVASKKATFIQLTRDLIEGPPRPIQPKLASGPCTWLQCNARRSAVSLSTPQIWQANMLNHNCCKCNWNWLTLISDPALLSKVFGYPDFCLPVLWQLYRSHSSVVMKVCTMSRATLLNSSQPWLSPVQETWVFKASSRQVAVLLAVLVKRVSLGSEAPRMAWLDCQWSHQGDLNTLQVARSSLSSATSWSLSWVVIACLEVLIRFLGQMMSLLKDNPHTVHILL